MLSIIQQRCLTTYDTNNNNIADPTMTTVALSRPTSRSGPTPHRFDMHLERFANG